MAEAARRIADKASARPPIRRRCADCGTDITHCHKQRRYCAECGFQRKIAGGIAGGAAGRMFPTPPAHLETVDPNVEPRNPREAYVQACQTANRKMWNRDRNGHIEDSEVSTAWTKQGMTATGATSSRKCLCCGSMFESLGPENRICDGCKATAAYASSADE